MSSMRGLKPDRTIIMIFFNFQNLMRGSRTCENEQKNEKKAFAKIANFFLYIFQLIFFE